MPDKPLASLSLDLDDLWSYLKTHGDAGWESRPSYLGVVVPRFLNVLKQLDVRITVFVVGLDASLPANGPILRSIVDEGHEIGNHSFQHEPWLHLYTEEQLTDELQQAEEAIRQATGQRPKGFRGPGFSHSDELLRLLAERGYRYDASSLPTFLGPLARLYYFLTTRLSAAQRAERKQLFGDWREGFRPIRPYRRLLGSRELWEIPVTVMPLTRTPIHLSYVLYLGLFSERLALLYLRSALWLCRLCKISPSFLLHPLDFASLDDAPALQFFPAMRMPFEKKMSLVEQSLQMLARQFRVLPLGQFCAGLDGASESPAERESIQTGPAL